METDKLLERLNRLWPVKWVYNRRTDNYIAIVRGVTISVWVGAGGEYNATVAACTTLLQEDSLRELLLRAETAVRVLGYQVIPEVRTEASEQERIWSILKKFLTSGKWTSYEAQHGKAYWDSQVGSHVVTVTVHADGRCRVRMEIKADGKLLYADSNLLEEGADENAVRNALTDVTYQMAGIK